MWWIAAVVGCGGPPDEAADDGACDAAGDERLYVVQSLVFVRQEAGVSDGFDLDGAVGGPDGCGIADFTAPDGATGVDNAFAYVVPALELTEAAAVESLIQAAIESGELLIALDLTELDGETDDACVDLSIGRASGDVLIGGDGRLLGGQTFAPDADAPGFDAPDVALVDGVLESPLELVLPLQIFDVALEFALRDGRLRLALQPDGTATGLFAGGVDIAYLLQIAAEENVDAGLHDVMEALLDSWADLAPDETGACSRISITFSFVAVPAFWYD
ncbi:MAG: hypothetical protein ABMB14_13310 [Myxococcota bacterium]